MVLVFKIILKNYIKKSFLNGHCKVFMSLPLPVQGAIENMLIAAEAS